MVRVSVLRETRVTTPWGAVLLLNPGAHDLADDISAYAFEQGQGFVARIADSSDEPLNGGAGVQLGEIPESPAPASNGNEAAIMFSLTSAVRQARKDDPEAEWPEGVPTAEALEPYVAFDYTSAQLTAAVEQVDSEG